MFKLRLKQSIAFILSLSIIWAGIGTPLSVYASGTNYFHTDTTQADFTGWYNPSWQYRQKLTIDHTKVDTTDQTNFPVLISLSGLSNINTNGADIRFTLGDGVTELAREIETYSGGTLTAWVKVPTLSASVDTTLYMYYGNSGASEPASSSTYGSQSVWDGDFKGVWHMKDNTTSTINDSTNNANNATKAASSSPAQVTGEVGPAQSFNGTGSYFTVPNSTSLQFGTGGFSLEFWLKPNVIPSSMKSLFNKDPDGTKFYSYLNTNGQIVFANLTNSAVYSNTLLSANNWYHISILRNGGTTNLYINGRLDASTNGTATTLSNTYPFNFSYANGYYLNALLDESKVSDIARSANWIKTEYNNQLNPSTFYTVGIRESYNANSYSTLSNIEVTGTGDIQLASNPGLSFDGISNYTQVANSASLNITGSALTVEAWINAYTGAQGVFINKENQYEFGILSSGTLGAAIDTVANGNSWAWIDSGYTMPTGTWHHIAVTYNGTNIGFYVDGVLVSTKANNVTGAIGSETTPLRFGARDSNIDGTADGFTKIQLDDMRIWSVVRSSANISSNMNTELTGSEAGLAGYWKFNEASGTTINDSTSNANNGTIYGALRFVSSGRYTLSPGVRTSETLDVSSVGTAGSSAIFWSAGTRANTSLLVETNLSTDGGTTWGGWQTAANGSAIPGITNSTDLSNGRLQYRTTLATTNTSVTPQLHGIIVNINVSGNYSRMDTSQDDLSTGASTNVTTLGSGDLILSSLTYKVSITIDNTANSSSFTNYQTAFTVDTASLITAGKMRSDCGDIRLVDSDGTTPLSHYIESGTSYSKATKIWVKVPSIPASSVKTIYMTYGNSALTSASDSTATFDSSVNTGDTDSYVRSSMSTTNFGTDWEVRAGGWGDTYYGLVQIPSTLFPSYLTSSNINNVSMNVYRYFENASSSSGSQTVYLRRITSSWTPGTVTWSTQPSIDSTTLDSETASVSASSNTAFSWKSYNITSWVTGWEAGSFTNYGMGFVPNSTSGLWMDFYQSSTANPWYITVTYNTNQYLIIEQFPGSSTQWRVRKTTANPPTASLGSEQTAAYVANGSYVSLAYDISTVGTANDSTISWNAVTPSNTTIVVETNLSTDGGTTWGGWHTATRGSAIPGITSGTALNSARLQYRVTMSAADTTVTPDLSDITININALVGPPPGPTVPSVAIMEARDLGNNDNASDIRVIFKGPSDESKIASYKIIVSTGTINEATASGLASSSYIPEPTKGRGRMHIVYLRSSLQSSGGGAVNAAGGSYNIYVLSAAKTGYSDKLSAPVSISLSTNNAGAKVEAPTPIASDVANNGNGADLKVAFKKPKSEANIQEYRIIVSTADLTQNAAASVPLAGYKQVMPTNPKLSYSATMGAAQTDQGGATSIQNGTPYKIYVLAIGKNGYANVLSNPSKTITLSQYVPGTYAVRGTSAAKVGTGHDSSNIEVTFYEPTVINNIQEYRILIVPSGTSLTLSTAEGVIQASRYQSVAVAGRMAAHTVTLGTGVSTYDGTAMAAGDYKVYVLTVGQTGYGNKLSVSNGIVKLD